MMCIAQCKTTKINPNLMPLLFVVMAGMISSSSGMVVKWLAPSPLSKMILGFNPLAD